MALTYGNLVRATSLLLFVASSTLCLFKPSQHALIVALLNLAGGAIFELLANSKRPEAKDHSKEIEELKSKNAKLEADFQVIKNNISIASASSMTRR